MEFAFPFEQRKHDGMMQRERGMTLRDYFAASALTGMLACGGKYGHLDGSSDAEENAKLAYWYADEMLKKRVL